MNKERIYPYRHYRWLLEKGIKDGKIVKSESCEQCGRSGLKINGHHEDYSKPLDLIWLCNRCHMRLHHGVAWDKPLSPSRPYDPDNRRTVCVDGRQYNLLRLKDDPAELSGLLTEEVLDEREYFQDTIDWESHITSLTPRERGIIRLRYSVGCDYNLTLLEVGKIFGITREAVRMAELKAVQKLRRAFRISES